MKIYFCDGCNASIPLSEMQAGHVTTIKGKLFCTRCLPPAAAAGAPAAPAPRQRGVALLAVVVVLLLGWTLVRDLGLIGGGALGDAAPAAGGAADERERDLERIAADVQALRDEAAERDRRLDFLKIELNEGKAQTEGLSRSVNQWLAEIERLGRGQVETGQLVEQLQLAENRTDVLEERVDTLADMVAGQQQQLALALAAGAGDTVGADGAEDGAPPVDPTRQAELEEIRRQLLDPDAGQRYDAVDRIQRGRWKELAPELILVLDDADTFVRLHAMQVIGDLGLVEAVPALLDVLADGSVVVRRTAKEQLVRLTGHDPGYDPTASKADRERAVERWRAWLEEA